MKSNELWKSLLTKKISWTEIISKMNFHLSAIERGEDHYEGRLHSNYLETYSSVLSQYYFLNVSGDDRAHHYMRMPRIGLDIDEVLADWVGPWTKLYNLPSPATSWYFDRQITERFESMRLDGSLDTFYLSLEPKIKGSELPFEPVCYITSRPVSDEVTMEWLDKHQFPARKVYTVSVGGSKIDAAKEAEVEVFVDDRFENFKEFNENGILCYLFDAPHNQRYNVGFKRIKSLNEIPCIQSIM